MLKIKNLGVYTSKKIVYFNESPLLISKLKKRGKTIGLCHGGFDLLHPGHVKHFESSKKLCDVLIVSITSDKFVSSRKGDGRPIFTDKLRAYMVANLGVVDYVIITDFKLGTDVIKALKPDIYIKGPDFINKTTPGITKEKKIIKIMGGKIEYTHDPKLGTTGVIDYIKTKLKNKQILLIIDRDGTIIKNNDFIGKNNNWKKELVFNNDVINTISYLQTKYNTTKIIITNQAGVARKLFDEIKVKEINKYINSKLSSLGIKINDWQYCPHVDSKYAKKHPELNLDPKYVLKKTKRKPSISMVVDALNQTNKKIEVFKKIIILGDRLEDKQLADNLNGMFIDVNNKSFEELKMELKL